MRLTEICEKYGLSPEGVDFALSQYQKVLSEITHGMLGKLTYDADFVIQTAQERWCDGCDSLPEWISVKDRLPEETASMFARFHATEKWSRAMWMKESETVLVVVAFPDGGKRATIGRLHDGEWHTSVSKTIPYTVTYWMPLPEAPEEDCDGHG